MAFGLRDGHHQQLARVLGGERFTAARPFPVAIVPARLMAGLLPD